MDLWKLTDDEWQAVGQFLEATGRERTRLENTPATAEVCLFRHFKSRSKTYHGFGWGQLSADFRIPPATANRRFRE